MEDTVKSRRRRRNQNRKLRKAQGLKVKFLGTAGELRSVKSDLDLTYYRIEDVDAVFQVSGGTSPHLLIVKVNGELHCACKNTASPCSHVLCYRLWLRKGDAFVTGKV